MADVSTDEAGRATIDRRFLYNTLSALRHTERSSIGAVAAELRQAQEQGASPDEYHSHGGPLLALLAAVLRTAFHKKKKVSPEFIVSVLALLVGR